MATRTLPKFLEAHETAALLAAAERSGPRDFALILVLVYAGLRISEAVNLRWADAGDGRLFVRRGKGAKQRYVPMHRRIAASFESLRMSGSAFRASDEGAKQEPGAFVFAGRDGGHYSRRGAQHLLERLCAEAGIPREKAHPHTLRHTFATNVLRRTGDLLKVSRLLGHASVSTTQIYTHLVFDDLAEAVGLLD